MIFRFSVNGKIVETTEDVKLLRFLRESLKLTSVKDGCSEGACGTCTVLIDGKPTRACISTSKLEGKCVITTEGLTSHEKDIYSRSFSECGAVQCGFCIPGMVMCAKALLDKNPHPTPKDVREAIKNNICRCTGYKKIEQAILMAAELFSNNSDSPKYSGNVGERMPRVDTYDKVQGVAEYVDDIHIPGMVYGGALRSTYPRAIVRHIDISRAKSAPGVLCVLTAEDIPGEHKIGHIHRDWNVLIGRGETTHYLGDAIALVAATSKDELSAALKLIEVEYEPLDPIISPEKALEEDAPLVHETGNILHFEHLVRGDAEAAIESSAHVVTRHYSTPFTEHAFLEPECSVALPNKDGIIIYSADQGAYQTRRECADMLALPEDKVQVIGKMIGGGFGGKEDLTVQHHAALLAYKLQLPVKVTLSRKESILTHPKRHAMEIDITTACDKEGMITAVKAVIVADTGAYASLGGPVIQRACTHAAGPYNISAVDVSGTAVYTNNPPGGAFRGFGVTQVCFASECNMNELAELVGISEYEIRYRNAIRPGQVLPNGQIADDSTAIVETLEAVKEAYHSEKYSGIACALKNTGVGVGLPDTGRCKLVILSGNVHTRTSAACIGQGLATVVTQIICEITHLSPDVIIHEQPDTNLTPDSGNTTASRQTLFCGEAAHRAAIELNEALQSNTLEALEGCEFYGEYTGYTDKMGTTLANPKSHIAYGYATHVVALNSDGKIKCITAAHDVGRAINPLTIEGQIEGGVLMGMGYALTEDFPLKDCMPTSKFGTLGLLRSKDAPDIDSIIVEKNSSSLALGAKGIGEISAIPTAPAIAGAYYKLDGLRRYRLPLEKTIYRKQK